MTVLQYAPKLKQLYELLENNQFEVEMSNNSKLILSTDFLAEQQDDFLLINNCGRLYRFVTVKAAYEFIYYN